MKQLRTIILAAGKGTRMKSRVPKVLHKVAGKPIVQYVLDVAQKVGSLKTYVVVGHQSEQVKQALPNSVEVVLQQQLRGTADAVRSAESKLKGFKGDVLIMCGDTPLLDAKIILNLLKRHRRLKASCTFLSTCMDDPSGYGRIIRDVKNKVLAIREQKDASNEETKIDEINVGVYCFDAQDLFKGLKKIQLNPKKKEFYLTDIIELLLRNDKTVDVYKTEDQTVALGVNSRIQLAEAEMLMRDKILEHHMINGVTLVDPMTTYIESDVSIGQDTVIQPMTVIHSGVKIGKNCSIGPMARIRLGTVLKDDVTIGNFSEISRTQIESGVVMKHFGFLGDTIVKQEANIGAGTVTANYDGKNKNKTVIGKKAFIGSDSILIAPLVVADEAIVGAGSVVLKNTKIKKGSLIKGVPAK